MHYPQEPWHLAGTLRSSIWLVPEQYLALEYPPGCKPLRLAGRLILLTAWVDYQPPGILTYREFLCGVAVRVNDRLALHIHQIWVDSETSLAGGRDLWGIPKEMALFANSGDNFSASSDSEPIASARFQHALSLPGWPTLSGATAQTLRGALCVTPLLAGGRLHFDRASWDIAPQGKLSFLHGRKPFLSLSLSPATIRFGPAHSVVS